jgi:serine/threonine protein kinase
MAEGDPHATQQNLGSGIAGELRNAGFDDVEEVGRGGFGIVYRCTQPELDRTVAVKVLTSDLDPDNLDRLLREQRAIIPPRHPTAPAKTTHDHDPTQ